MMFKRDIRYLEKDVPKVLHVSIAHPVVVTPGSEASCEITFSGSYESTVRLSGIDEMQAAQLALNFAQGQIDEICGDDWTLSH